MATSTRRDRPAGTTDSDARYRRVLAALVTSRVDESQKTGKPPGGSHAYTSSSGTHPARTIFVLHEPSAAVKGLRVAIIWTVIGAFMATADALSPQTSIQVSWWLGLFFLGVLLSFWVLLNVGRAAAATGALIGTFLGPYSLTWQLWVTYVKHWSGFFPIRLYPFTIVLDATEWYAMMGVGFILFAGSIAALAHLSRPRPTFVRVHHDSGEAYRLGEHP